MVAELRNLATDGRESCKNLKLSKWQGGGKYPPPPAKMTVSDIWNCRRHYNAPIVNYNALVNYNAPIWQYIALGYYIAPIWHYSALALGHYIAPIWQYNILKKGPCAAPRMDYHIPMRRNAVPHSALAAIGGLSKPSKMPGHGFSLPAAYCQTGSILRLQDGSTCAACYACKGRYLFANVQAAMERRWQLLMAALQGDDAAQFDYELAWDRVLEYLQAKGETWFRWHDSGDLQGPDHARLILRLAQAHPRMHFWLPTKEYALAKLMEDEGIPANLCVRLSRPMVGQPCPITPAGPLAYSSVRPRGTNPFEWEFKCPAPDQGNTCGDCRACWNPSVQVCYEQH
jgi:hypothetical protein